MFRFYLDNNLVEDATNWDDFSETIERDDQIKGLLPKYEVKLQFNSSGYKYLFEKLFTSGFCQLVELRVDYACSGNNYKPILNGYIFLTECKFNLNKCTVDCEVEDNNYGARIYRNKSIKVYLDSNKTKNGEDLTTCSFKSSQFFTPTTGTYSGATRKLYELKDAFRFLIEFMTDNQVGFESDYFFDERELRNLTLVSGEGIRDPSGALAPFISFEELFKEVNKKYPIAFTIIQGSDGRPTMKIEDEAYFFNQTNSIQIDNIEDLRQSFDNEVLYSSVRFGGTTATINPAIHHFGYIRFLSFREEQYFMQGSCNIDKTLDLYGDFICDSNIIEEIFVTGTSNDSYDENVFFVHTDGTNASKTDNPTTGATPYYYNGTLTNDQVSDRYNYNGSLALFLSGAIIGFRASKNVNQAYGAFTFTGSATCPATTTSPAVAPGVYVLYQDDTTSPNFDTAGNYSTGLSRYTASVAGEYVFETNINYSTTKLSSTFAMNMYHKTYVEFRRFNSGGTLMQSSQNTNPNTGGFYNGQGIFNIYHNCLFTLDVGDYVQVAFWFEYAPVNCGIDSSIIMTLNASITNTFFRTLSSPTAGGVYQEENTNPYRTSKFEFERPLSFEEYETLKSDLSKSVIFNHKPLTNKTGWLRKTIRNYATGTTTWELISNITNSN